MSKIKEKALAQALSEMDNLICLDVPKLKQTLLEQSESDSDIEVLEKVSDPSEKSILHNLILLALPSPSQQIH